MDDYLSMPFNRKQLQEVLTQWLSSQKATLVSANKPEWIAGSSINYINSEALNNLREITTETGESLLNKKIKIFSHSAPKEIKALQQALASQDSHSMTQIAHSFKSACGNIGAQKIAGDVALIEEKAREGELEGIQTLLEHMISNLPETLLELSRELEKHAPVLKPGLVTKEKKGTKSKRILLVDDDNSFRLIAKSVLSASSYIVDEAESGSQALNKIKHHYPDVILLDALMDGLDGFETCRQFRKDPKLADVPIIMSTGLGDMDSIHHEFECGATDFIVKPINYPILIHRLGFILRAGQDSAELRSSKVQLAEAQRIARMGHWIWNVRQNLFEMSEQLAELCGINLRVFSANLESFIGLVEPEDQASVKAMIMDAPYSNHSTFRI